MLLSWILHCLIIKSCITGLNILGSVSTEWVNFHRLKQRDWKALFPEHTLHTSVLWSTQTSWTWQHVTVIPVLRGESRHINDLFTTAGKWRLQDLAQDFSTSSYAPAPSHPEWFYLTFMPCQYHMTDSNSLLCSISGIKQPFMDSVEEKLRKFTVFDHFQIQNNANNIQVFAAIHFLIYHLVS